MPKSSSRYTVTVARREQTMTKVVNDDSFTIGRSLDCTIPLTEDSISRVHVIVTRHGDQVWIEDKGSSNGTFVNNNRIPHTTPTQVTSADKIRIGKSDYVVSIHLEVADSDAAAKMTRVDETNALASAVAQQVQQQQQQQAQRQAQQVPQQVLSAKIENAAPAPTPTPTPAASGSPKFSAKDLMPKEFQPKEEGAPAYSSNPAAFEGERILHEAHKKGAQIIYEAEVQAEKRAQAIYVAAKERQTQADEYYQKKISDAHKEVDRVLQGCQHQGQELLAQARQFAQEIRDEVDMFSAQSRENARKQAEQIETEAREESESIKKEAYEKAITQAEIESEDLRASARAEAQDIVNFAKQSAEEMLSKARGEMENELKDLVTLIDEKKKALHNLKKEQEDQQIKALGEKEEIEGRLLELNSKYNSLIGDYEKIQKDVEVLRAEEGELSTKIKDQKKSTEELEHQIGQLYGDSKTLERKNKELQEHLGRFTLDIQSIEEQKRQNENDLLQQKNGLKDRLDRDYQVMLKDSEERMQEAQLDMSKRMMKMEQEMLEEIMGRKETLVKDIIVIIETRIAKVLEPAKWDQVSGLIYDGISETIEGKAVTFSTKAGAPKESASLLRKKKKENYRWMAVGITAGIIASVLGVSGYNRIVNDRNPMRTIAAEESRRRQADLERRRFNPPQVSDVKDTYVDSVIYTSGYVQAYQNADFQQKLYKAASAYLLKTWRVDEDKSIQVLSMSNALIKELNEKRATIHPDFVKEGIAKMRELEKGSLDRMKVVLGSEVRLESYRRFERKFYEAEILKK